MRSFIHPCPLPLLLSVTLPCPLPAFLPIPQQIPLLAASCLALLRLPQPMWRQTALSFFWWESAGHTQALLRDVVTGVVDICLIPEVNFNLDGAHGLMAYVQSLLADKGHCVICVAEGAGQVQLPHWAACLLILVISLIIMCHVHVVIIYNVAFDLLSRASAWG